MRFTRDMIGKSIYVIKSKDKTMIGNNSYGKIDAYDGNDVLTYVRVKFVKCNANDIRWWVDDDNEYVVGKFPKDHKMYNEIKEKVALMKEIAPSNETIKKRYNVLKEMI